MPLYYNPINKNKSHPHLYIVQADAFSSAFNDTTRNSEGLNAIQDPWALCTAELKKAVPSDGMLQYPFWPKR